MCEEFRVIIRAYDPKLPALYQMAHILVGSTKAQKWMQEARWQNSEDGIQDPQSSTSQGPGKACKIAIELLQAIPRVFPACIDWSIIQTCKRRKDESVGLTLKPIWRPPFYGIWSSINTTTQSALAALFVNGFFPGMGGLIRRQKIVWEATSLTEFVTMAEHFERTME